MSEQTMERAEATAAAGVNGAAAGAAAPADTVKVAAAKGRPMLTWVGKRPLREVKAFPAQHVETFTARRPDGPTARRPDGPTARRPDGPTAYPQGGILFHGDNKEVLGHLLANGFRGKVNLIYIDPPFDSGADYVRKVTLRGPKGTAKLDGEAYTLGEQIQYTDIWANDNYLQFMYERVLLLKELLDVNGAFALHCNTERSHYLKLLLDEVFEPACFLNEIVWQRREAHSDTVGVGNVHDVILLYGASPEVRLKRSYLPYEQSYLASHYSLTDPDGRRYQLGDLTAPGPRPGLNYEFRGVWPPAGRVWAVLPHKMEDLDRAGRVVMTSEGRPRRKQYLDEMPGMPVHDIWTDVSAVNSQAHEGTGYPTQKPEALLRRILDIATSPGDLVLDSFAGSGTTAAVAQKLGRRWIAADINKGAIQTTTKRLHGIIAEQAAAQPDLTPDPGGPAPAQLAFTTWRVNDYDLQVQHNEAVNLAAEYLGVQRTRADGFFDGTLGRSLVRIIPFGRPLTPLDLEEIKRELEARPDEDRPVTVVCLGVEVAVQAWVDDWNALRRGADAVNKLRVVELRTDPKYGGFLKHEPARARVRVRRRGDRLDVEVTDFVSPAIVQRLAQQAGVLAPRVDDWRAMVDSVMIDPAYDGRVFNAALVDVPERKAHYVRGRYELPAPNGSTTVAVKVTDMLGEEVVEVRQEV